MRLYSIVWKSVLFVTAVHKCSYRAERASRASCLAYETVQSHWVLPNWSLSRCSTTCLIMVLCPFYPQYMFWLQLLVALNISSHWIQMYSSLIRGETSHKVTDPSANPILRLYYTSWVIELWLVNLKFVPYSCSQCCSRFLLEMNCSSFHFTCSILTMDI